MKGGKRSEQALVDVKEAVLGVFGVTPGIQGSQQRQTGGQGRRVSLGRRRSGPLGDGYGGGRSVACPAVSHCAAVVAE